MPIVALYVFVDVLGLGMGWLSVSRSIGQFLSNLIVGLLFVLSQFASYFYVFAAASLATAILLMTEQ